MLVAEGSTIAGINFCNAYVLDKCSTTNLIAQYTNKYFVVRVDKAVNFFCDDNRHSCSGLFFILFTNAKKTLLHTFMD